MKEAPKVAAFRASKFNQSAKIGERMNTSTDLALNVDHRDVTMSSRDIASLTGKRHDHVIRDIEKMYSELGSFTPNLGAKVKSSTYIDSIGRTLKQYELDREMTMTLITGYSIPLRHRVIQRWQELEEKTAHPQIPQTMSEALRLAADQADVIEKQNRELIAMAPKAAFSDRVQIAEDAITVGEAAKLIGTGRTRLFTFLRQHKWVNRRNEPYQAKIEAGFLDVKVSHWEHPEDGLKENITALVTGKGLIKLQQLWAQEKEHAA